MKIIRSLMKIISVFVIIVGLGLLVMCASKLLSGDLKHSIMAITPMIPAILFIIDGIIGIGISISKIKLKDVWFWILLLIAVIMVPLARAINLGISG